MLHAAYCCPFCSSCCSCSFVCRTFREAKTQAKFKVPRCLEMFSSKQYEKLWRPTLHLVLCIVHGVCECYYVMDGDCKKDSNMQITLINRSIDTALQILRLRNVEAPHHVCIQADNTTREQRNQYLFLWAAVATSKGLFASVSPVFYLPGHSHNEVDQRFVVVAAAVSRAQELQTAEAYVGPTAR